MTRKDSMLLAAAALTALAGTATPAKGAKKTSGARPNIILIMADDMGYSVITPYGGEIPTPNLERLSRNGVNYTQFYNTARWKNWKAVWDQQGKVWELYDIDNDRTERHNLASERPDILKQLTDHWDQWAATHHVYPKPY